MFAIGTIRNNDASAGSAQESSAAREDQVQGQLQEEGVRLGPAGIDWAALVEEVKSGDEAGMEHMYKLFSRGIRYYLHSQLGPQELDDKIHDTFLIVVNAIRRGDLREPDRLMGFIRTVVRRQVAGYIETAVNERRNQTDLETGSVVADRRQNPEQEALIREKAALMKSALATLSERDREILVRFYLHEQPIEQICQEMSLTETQFRLTKSRAKAKFGEIGQKKLKTSGIFLKLMRRSSA